jgi:hypothetical protein
MLLLTPSPDAFSPPIARTGIVSELHGDDYDLVTVLRPRDEGIPLLPGVPEVMSWSFAALGDPETVEPEGCLAAARRIRDELRTRVGSLVDPRGR